MYVIARLILTAKVLIPVCGEEKVQLLLVMKELLVSSYELLISRRLVLKYNCLV